MKTIWWMLILLLVTGMTACKKESVTTPPETFTKYPPPTWKADDSGKYPASMTAVVSLPTTLQASASETDQLAAFINDECRGEGVRVKVDDAYVYFVLIHGLADEQSKIVFKYYNEANSYLYQTAPDVRFKVDDVYGTAENPELLSLSQVK